MKQKVGTKSIVSNDCHLTIVSANKIVSIHRAENGEYQCFIPNDEIFEIHISYFGFDAGIYRLYIDDKPVIARNGKEGRGILSFLKRETHDIWQSFLDEKKKWQFNADKEICIKLQTQAALTSPQVLRSVEFSDEEKKITPEQVNFSVDPINGTTETIFLKIKEDTQFKNVY